MKREKARKSTNKIVFFVDDFFLLQKFHNHVHEFRWFVT